MVWKKETAAISRCRRSRMRYPDQPVFVQRHLHAGHFMYQPQDANGRSENTNDSFSERRYLLAIIRFASNGAPLRVTWPFVLQLPSRRFFFTCPSPPPCVINFFDNPPIADLLPVAFKFPRLNPSNPYRSNSFSLSSFLSFLISIRPISRVPFL